MEEGAARGWRGRGSGGKGGRRGRGGGGEGGVAIAAREDVSGKRSGVDGGEAGRGEVREAEVGPADEGVDEGYSKSSLTIVITEDRAPAVVARRRWRMVEEEEEAGKKKGGEVTLQSDMYAFGVVLLELLTSRRAINLSQGPQDQNLIVKIHQMVGDRKKLRKVVDREMGTGSYTVESVSMFAGLAARCVCFESSGRPSMQDCVKELQFIM